MLIMISNYYKSKISKVFSITKEELRLCNVVSLTSNVPEVQKKLEESNRNEAMLLFKIATIPMAILALFNLY